MDPDQVTQLETSSPPMSELGGGESNILGKETKTHTYNFVSLLLCPSVLIIFMNKYLYLGIPKPLNPAVQLNLTVVTELLSCMVLESLQKQNDTGNNPSTHWYMSCRTFRHHKLLFSKLRILFTVNYLSVLFIPKKLHKDPLRQPKYDRTSFDLSTVILNRSNRTS